MPDIENLYAVYQYIRDKYNNLYCKIQYNKTKIIITFYKEFEMEIRLQLLYNIYFNNVFYYDIDSQDIISTIDDIFTDKYIFYKYNKRIKIASFDDFKEINCDKAWTIRERLK